MFEKSKIELPKSELIYNDDEHTYKTKNGLLIPCVSDIIKPVTDYIYGGIGNLSMAQERGTMVHLAIELYDNVGVETIPEEYSNYFEAYKKFLEENDKKYKLVANEYAVYCVGLGYCGTIDKILEDTKTGEIIIVDNKTSHKIEYLPLKLQLAGYKFALESLGLKVSKTKVLHLKADKTFEFEDIESNLKVFMSCLQILNYCKGGK